MDDEMVLKTIIAEGANQDPEGMYAIASTIMNRSTRRNLTPRQVVDQRKRNKKGKWVAQFTGRYRPDLDQFVASQPPEVHQAAQLAWQRAQAGPMPGIDHYLTNELYKKVSPDHWARTMGGKRVIGGHTFMDSRKGPDQAKRTNRIEDGLRHMHQMAEASGFGGLEVDDIHKVLAQFSPPVAIHQNGSSPLKQDQDRLIHDAIGGRRLPKSLARAIQSQAPGLGMDQQPQRAI